MADIVTPPELSGVRDVTPDDPMHRGGLGAFDPGRFSWYGPRLRSSDIEVRFQRDRLASSARDLARTNSYGKSALRTTCDSLIGIDLRLQLSPVSALLGVTEDEAADWAERVEDEFDAYANGVSFNADAQRAQTFSGLMWTSYASKFVAGECLGAVEYKDSSSGYRTCLQLIEPERLSDQHDSLRFGSGIRMGVQRDTHGAAIGYYIRRVHRSDSIWDRDISQWDYYPRFTPWGRPVILHYFERDRPDMTRGFSDLTSAIQAMEQLKDYTLTELESAALRATYAAVITSELDWAAAMNVIGPDVKRSLHEGMATNPFMAAAISGMRDVAEFYKGHDIRMGQAKIAHLLPNEDLKMVQPNAGHSQLRDFNDVNRFDIAAGTGVDHASLTKDYSQTSYSGARASLFDVWRSYEVRRRHFVAGFALPFVDAWLEEAIVARETIPMLGRKPYYEVKDALLRGAFESWGKPRLDPQKEALADEIEFGLGILTQRDMCSERGGDWRKKLKQRAREKAEMDRLGLTWEDLNPELMSQNKDPAQKPDNSGGNS